ncbi:hypothetical protein Bca4012_095293 [Brassica carinata]
MGNFVSHSQNNNQHESRDDVSLRSKESQYRGKLWECMKAHSDYYQPIIDAVESAKKAVRKEAQAVMAPSSVGRDVMEWRKDPKVREEVDKYYDFMERGACKESWIALAECWYAADCAKEDKDKLMFMLCECVEAHSDYYHPVLEPASKVAEEQLFKELEAFVLTSSDQPKVGEDELTERILEFMNGGDCKESFTPWLDIIIEEAEAEAAASS